MARFQLFGDTVNTSARLSSTGTANRIHASEETAMSLQSFGKADWLHARNETVMAKGKGALSTYWIVPNERVLEMGNFSGELSNASEDEELRGSLSPDEDSGSAFTGAGSEEEERVSSMDEKQIAFSSDRPN